MTQTYRCHGEVVDPQGQPVPGAFVRIARATAQVPEVAVLSGPDGKFEMRLPAGRFTLAAHAGSVHGTADVDSADGGGVQIVLEG